MSRSISRICCAVGLSIGLMALPITAAAQGEQPSSVAPFGGTQWVKTTSGATVYVTYAEYLDLQRRIALQQAFTPTATRVAASRAMPSGNVSQSPWLIGAFR